MGVTDNQLNWRRVQPWSPVDVSGWTLAQKMSLPDWCFGNREVIGIDKSATGSGDIQWEISSLALPANICIWHIGIFLNLAEKSPSYARIGLTAAKPTNVGEMDAAVEVLQYFGDVDYAPRRIYFSNDITEPWQFPLKKSLATEGKKLTLEVYCGTTKIAVTVYMVFSELPISVPAFLNPDIP